MITAFPPCLNRWKSLYRAAILETNKRLLPQRVSEAEEAVRVREREIFYGNGTPEEKEALEDALYALRAFRTAFHTRRVLKKNNFALDQKAGGSQPGGASTPFY